MVVQVEERKRLWSRLVAQLYEFGGGAVSMPRMRRPQKKCGVSRRLIVGRGKQEEGLHLA